MLPSQPRQNSGSSYPPPYALYVHRAANLSRLPCMVHVQSSFRISCLERDRYRGARKIAVLVMFVLAESLQQQLVGSLACYCSSICSGAPSECSTYSKRAIANKFVHTIWWWKVVRGVSRFLLDVYDVRFDGGIF